MKKKSGNRSAGSKVIPFPNLEKRLLDKGMDALKEKRYKDALQIFNQFRGLHPDYPEVEIGIVICLLELGLYEDAKEKCERLLHEDIGDYFNVLQIYITILIQLSEYDQVVSMLEVLFEEEKVPEGLAGELFHLLEFSRKSSDTLRGDFRHDEPAVDVQAYVIQLTNGNITEQLHAIQNLRKAGPLTKVSEDLKSVLANTHAHPIIQSMVLQLMMEKEMDESVIVQKFNRTSSLNPIKVKNIFEQPFTIQVLNKVEDILSQENPTLYESVKVLWERFLFVLFPFQPEPIDTTLWAAALHKVGYQMFGIELSDNELERTYNVEMEYINQACRQIIEVEERSTLGLNE